MTPDQSAKPDAPNPLQGLAAWLRMMSNHAASAADSDAICAWADAVDLLARPPAGHIEAMREAKEAARQFHNLTLGDPAVIIRAPSAEKRDAIAEAGKRLRAAIALCGRQHAA